MRTLLAGLALALAGSGTAGTPPTGSTPRTAPERVVWSCRVESLGTPAVMVDFANATALSTRSAAVAPAAVEGDVATWQENDADGIGYRFSLDRRTGALQVRLLSGPRQGLVHRGQCGPPAPKPRR